MWAQTYSKEKVCVCVCDGLLVGTLWLHATALLCASDMHTALQPPPTCGTPLSRTRAGINLTKISLPVCLFEPRSFLERVTANWVSVH